MVGGYDMNGVSGAMAPDLPIGGPVFGDEKWIPILDYAVLRGISTSTLRRYIKARKIKYKIENGRYLLAADSRLNWDGVGGNSLDSTYTRIRDLEEKLAQAQEQIGELKMLVAIYEEKLSS